MAPPNPYSINRSRMERNSNFHVYCQPVRPPEPSPGRRMNFIVELHPDAGMHASRENVEALIKERNFSPDSFAVRDSGSDPARARLFFTMWSSAMDTMVALWEKRFDEEGHGGFSPSLLRKVIVASDSEELNDRLKSVFVARIWGFLDGEMVTKWRNKMDTLEREIAAVSATLKRPQKIGIFEELRRKKEGLISEKNLVMKRLAEFEAGLRCILDHLSAEKDHEEDECRDARVFAFEKGKFNWERIFQLIMRERRRLDQGLPIYAFRREIVMVLIGETGSGKSTQLVQFLIDAGISVNGSIVCTQPRKIAAMSLSDRVQDESSGCYGENAVSCYPSYSSSQRFNADAIYMTDHCLLQHCINDKKLSKISCIVVDEAHERSLNTDLLLAMIKNLLCYRFDLRLVIMSATADADQLSDYFFGCGTFKVVGRNFPVDVKYVPCVPIGTSVPSDASSASIAPYVLNAIRMASEVHRQEKEGTVLAFLTSQMEVEWACERFQIPGSVALPFHGKLSREEQSQVFQNYPGKRKVIFATNIAETSLTIPGVKYVIDSGMLKESRYEPSSGMNVLRVSWVSKSSANQRAGRAGRTEPGHCYRLYTQEEFELMPAQQEPEIRRVHLGVAVLKILALGMKEVSNFDFVDAPSAEAIDMAIRNLVQLGAVTVKGDVIELSEEGIFMVKLGIEPRLGKLILCCTRERLGKEGLVLAALMANSSSIFCRVGNNAEKFKSDRLKVPFCHRDGDLFTLLSVYMKWESLPFGMRNKWCWENSINAKSMRRCYDTISELENCLQTELRKIIPSYWLWVPDVATEHDRILKRAIFASLSENIASYSGCDELGYEIASSGKHIQLHPSCSLHMFSQKPSWVVFGDILSVSDEYLTCVTAFDSEFLSTLHPPPPFDVLRVENRRLQMQILSGFGSGLLKRFCGKYNRSLCCLLSNIRTVSGDDRISIQVSIGNNEIRVFAALHDMEMVLDRVKNVLKHEKKWLENECIEKCLYQGGAGAPPPVALFGAGAEIKHLELDQRCLSVDVYHSNISSFDDKKLLMLIENHASGVCNVRRFTGHCAENMDKAKWGTVTFLSPDAAQRALGLNSIEFHGSLLKASLYWTNIVADRSHSFSAVNAKVYWPRRYSKGFGFVKCEAHDVCFMLDDFANLLLAGKFLRCERSSRCADSIMISGIDKGLSEIEVLNALRAATNRRILDFFLVRGDAVVANPPCRSCEEALSREIISFMPKGNPLSNCCRVQVFQPEPKDINIKALITFDGRLHLEAAKALEQIEGMILPGFEPWQKIQCQRLFHSSVSCPSSVYHVIRHQLDLLLAGFKHQKGVECCLERNNNGSFRVKISANATKIVAEVRRPLEMLMKGTAITNTSLTPSALQNLFSKDGITLMRSIQQDTGTYILFDRHALNVKIFGLPDDVASAEQKLVQHLLELHENKKMEILLRREKWPPDLMKSVVSTFGPDLHGLKEKVPEAEFSLNTRRHLLSISGGSKETKRKVEMIIDEIATSDNLHSPGEVVSATEATCPICLCEMEDEYQLENCLHAFCSQCLVDQCESALRSRDSFPICCSREGCGVPILLVDLKSLLSGDKIEELFRASLSAFVTSSGGAYRFCPSPDCPSVYKVASPEAPGQPFKCGACFSETCTRCHVEYHPYLSCEKYQEFKEDPDLSLKEWSSDKDNVKRCPVCGYTIEKVEGCNHIVCRCERHICWVCLEHFGSDPDCYTHLREVHKSIT
ncbi:hypothetical protein V2J09_021708 [Rumex salicifolius]